MILLSGGGALFESTKLPLGSWYMKYSPASLFLIIASTMNQHKEKITFKVAGAFMLLINKLP
jgi:hypothetical protein